MNRIDRYRGCLTGGAAGDALGYPVEFMDEDNIRRRYGEKGITSFPGEGLVSDDTQMTLFTANGLLLKGAADDSGRPGGTYEEYIWRCYGDWYRTQFTYGGASEGAVSWLNSIDRLNASRAPGNTCLGAISGGVMGTVERPVNKSKGCGGIMRVAPVGLYLPGRGCSSADTDDLGAAAAALTHGHPLGYIPAAALVHMVDLLAHEDASLKDAAEDMMRAMEMRYHNGYFDELMKRAVQLSSSPLSDIDAIHSLGEGWVAEETMAIALFCSLRYEDDFEKALCASVNHRGDSDSTGAVTGNILGAYLGISAIPEKYIADLELYDVITDMADSLYEDRPSEDDRYMI